VLNDGAAGLCMGTQAAPAPQAQTPSTQPPQPAPLTRDHSTAKPAPEAAARKFEVEDARQLFSKLARTKP
jgi:hypothetical protein